MWAGPRNISTTMMYSFAQRSDTEVLDEPLYAHYLKQSGVDHPGRNEILQTYSNNGHEVFQAFFQRSSPSPLLFIKNMGHHFTHLQVDECLKKMDHIFLIRRSDQVIASFSKVISHPVLQDIGIQDQWNLYEKLVGLGKAPIVIDGNEVLKAPGKVLSALCHSLGIPFEEEMLHWKKGPRSEDGIWAKYWYHNVHSSTGFQPYTPKEVVLPAHLKKLEQEAMPYYENLYAKAIKAI